MSQAKIIRFLFCISGSDGRGFVGGIHSGTTTTIRWINNDPVECIGGEKEREVRDIKKELSPMCVRIVYIHTCLPGTLKHTRKSFTYCLCTLECMCLCTFGAGSFEMHVALAYMHAENIYYCVNEICWVQPCASVCVKGERVPRTWLCITEQVTEKSRRYRYRCCTHVRSACFICNCIVKSLANKHRNLRCIHVWLSLLFPASQPSIHPTNQPCEAIMGSRVLIIISNIT